MLKIISNPCDDLILFSPMIHKDDRGYFVERHNRMLSSMLGFEFEFVQENESYSIKKGTIRGLHYQKPPFEQTKILSVVKGSIYDVVVDLRTASPNFGKCYSFCLDSKEKQILVVPKGFLHGFCTLENNTVVNYKVDSIYSREHEISIRWNDISLSIDWPIFNDYHLSVKDANAPNFYEVFPEVKL